MKHDDGTAEKVKKRVGWLNANAGLQSPIMYDKVAPTLAGLSLPGAMQILKDVEGKATEVRDPTAYVLGAARRRGSGGGMAGPPMYGGATGPGDEKVRKRI